ncbi:MAG: hypothetical protein HQK63_14990 [Desulfamplus sp.]|nr:hypothetical protein [Desulfamplus sp.]
MTDKQKKPDKTDWHRLWGMMVSPLFERLGCEVTVEVDLSLKAQRLDMTVVTKTKPISFEGVNPEYYQGFENLNDHNLISFKSFNEVFNLEAIEEFYGHFSNYKKMKNIKEQGVVNLYAVTHHFPKDLFDRYIKTDLLECIAENRIYDLKVFTPVRFIITNAFEHPILGLFSNDPEQIMKSRRQLEQDGWLLEHVSSYLEKLYKFYSLEGVNMPYTKEMFFRDYYPEKYEQILIKRQKIFEEGMKQGMQKGMQQGMQQGTIIGGIIAKLQLLQKILNRPVSKTEELIEKNISELQAMAESIEKDWQQIQN